MPTIPEEHARQAPRNIRCAAITVSDTRTLETDTGGQNLIAQLVGGGHVVMVQKIIPDEPTPMRALLEELCQREDIDAVLLTGGTGITSRDQTYETVSALLDKPLPGYGELFRWLSYKEIGPATILSRAVGGITNRTLVLTMPGSPAAVQLALEKIILPEIGHLVREAQR